MTAFLKRLLGAASISAALLTSVAPAQAGYVVTLRFLPIFPGSDLGDVFARGSGSIDLTGLTQISTGTITREIEPSTATIVIGNGAIDSPSPVTFYSGPITGPTSFGTRGLHSD